MIQRAHNAAGVTVQQPDIVALLAAQEEMFQEQMSELRAMAQQHEMAMGQQRNQFLDNQQCLVQNEVLLENTTSQQTRIIESQDYLSTQLQQLSIQRIDRSSDWSQSSHNSVPQNPVPAQDQESLSIQTP